MSAESGKEFLRADTFYLGSNEC